MVRALLVFILLLLIGRAFWRVMDGVIEAAGGRRSASRPSSRGLKLVRDPVCGTYVPPGTSPSMTSGGTTHYFCSTACLEKYRARA